MKFGDYTIELSVEEIIQGTKVFTAWLQDEDGNECFYSDSNPLIAIVGAIKEVL